MTDSYRDAIKVLERETRERTVAEGREACRVARRILLSEIGEGDAPPVRPLSNPNSTPMGCIIDVYLKHPSEGPSMPYKWHEARRYAIEQVRNNDVEEVVA